MPGPALIAAGAGLASAGIGAMGARSAANAQKDASNQQIALQREQFNRTDELQKGLYDEQSKDNRNIFAQLGGYAGRERAGNRAEALRLETGGKNALLNSRDANVRDLRGAMGDNLDASGQTMRTNIGDINREEHAGLAGFNPFRQTGTNAMQAYASNLGVGKAPKGYSGIELSPGAQFQMEQGRNAVEGSASSRGLLNSGSTLASLTKYGQGVGAMDRDNQMAQLFGLGQQGLSAAGSAASLRSNASAGRVGQRDTRYAQDAATRGFYTPAISGERSNAANSWYNIGANRANAMTGANSGYADRMIGGGQNFLSNMGAARGQRANLYGTASANAMNGMSSALANRGDAAAAGAIGGSNSILGGMNNALGIYSMFGGQFGGQQQPYQPTHSSGSGWGGGAWRGW